MTSYDNWKFNYCLKINQAVRRCKLATAKTSSYYTQAEACKLLKVDSIPRSQCPLRWHEGEWKYSLKDLLNYKKQL
jgi:hypothetical protein